MVKVRGADPETINLPDINDRVYYGQEKIFSESQYARSQDLKREIKKGRLLLVERQEETFADFKIPESANVPQPPAPIIITQQDPKEDNAGALKDLHGKMDTLFNKVEELQTGLKNQKPEEVKSQEINPNLIEQLLAAIQDASSKNNSDSHMGEIKSRLENLSEKLGNLSTASPSKNQEITDENIAKRMEEIYVPSVTVEDTKNNVNLEIRVVDQKDSVQDSLDKLRKLKQQV